ncbi:MAG: hypothetical protein WC484_05730 [Candidatus Omnitrophota bacterium]
MGLASGIFILTLVLIVRYRMIQRGSTARASFSLKDQPVAPCITGAAPSVLSAVDVKKFSSSGARKQDVMKTLRPFMAAAITIVLLVVSLFILFSESFDEPSKKWSSGTIGTLIGFWLK